MRFAQDVIFALKRFHNVVLEGVPGTGKTYIILEIKKIWNEIARQTLQGDGGGNYAITLHPSTAYEDFVEGLRPSAAKVKTEASESKKVTILQDGEELEFDTADTKFFFSSSYLEKSESSHFSISDGFIVKICTEAVLNPDKDFIILLDELNRANVPKVLGDLLTTIEKSKRAKALKNDDGQYIWSLENTQVVTLPYSGRLFFVPNNIYILATMNTSDYSIAPLDAALRRRFAFLRVEPIPKEDLIELISEILNDTNSLPKFEESIDLWNMLNLKVLEPCLGPDSLLGHSYFINAAQAFNDHYEELHLIDDENTKDLMKILHFGFPTEEGEVKRAFWVETGGLTGGSGNQLDLSHIGSRDNDYGIIHLFLGGRQENKTTPIMIDIKFEDSTYKSNKIWFAEKNGTWRIQLNGVDESGNRLTPIADRQFKNIVLSFIEYNINQFEVRVHSKDVIDRFKIDSIKWDETRGGQNSRIYGEFNIYIENNDYNSDPLYSMWRFELLPQLIERLITQGAEPLLDKNLIDEWFEERPELSLIKPEVDYAIGQLSSYLRKYKMKVSVKGTGLGRIPHISNLPSETFANESQYSSAESAAAVASSATAAEDANVD